MLRQSPILLAAALAVLLGGLVDSRAASDPQSGPPTPTPSPAEKQSSLDLTSANLKTETRKSEKKELTNKNPLTTSPPESSNSVIYRLNSDDGSTCILLRVDAILMFKYTTKLNVQEEKDMFVPASATVTGDCSGEDEQTLILRWRSFVLKFNFDKTPGGERWFVVEVELKFDPTDSIFEHYKDPGRTYTLSSRSSHKYQQLLFLTPVGKSYWCDREIDVKLENKKTTDTVASLLLRDLKIEPFIFKNDEFGPEYKCSAVGAGSFRSETAPLVIGSALAASCLATIAGYSIFRYYKIKKVEYNTME